MYKVVIVGSGMAGMTAALYAARAGIEHILIEKESFPGGQIVKTSVIDNYPGFERISGAELILKIKKQCEDAGVKSMKGNVVSIKKTVSEKQKFEVILSDGQTLTCENVILAVGAKPRTMDVPGEDSFAGSGVSYCATCDGPLYKKRKTVVIGGGNSALRSALFLSELAEKVVIVHRRNEFKAEAPLVEKAKARSNITIITDSVPESIIGDERVSALVIRNVNTGSKQEISCEGIFVTIGNDPDTQSFADLVELDEQGYIVAGEDCVTSIPGIYAVGDCRSGRMKQLVTAAADGAVAVSMIGR
ncbi:MAG: thioredoxin-disulfide reductase [Lachnospiraceae bacterium]